MPFEWNLVFSMISHFQVFKGYEKTTLLTNIANFKMLLKYNIL